MGTFYTAQYGKPGIDITYRAKHTFSPTREMVRAYLESRITWEQYALEYAALMRDRYRANPKAFTDVSGTFKCYCARTARCHRFLLAAILEKCGNTYGGEIT